MALCLLEALPGLAHVAGVGQVAEECVLRGDVEEQVPLGIDMLDRLLHRADRLLPAAGLKEDHARDDEPLRDLVLVARLGVELNRQVDEAQRLLESALTAA